MDKYNCQDYKLFINTNDELQIKCRKEFCKCEDKFIWAKEKDKKYQKAKKEGRAENGKLLK